MLDKNKMGGKKMRGKSKRIMGLLLALFMIIGCLPLNTIETYAAERDVVINETNFPDENFRGYLRKFDKDHSGSLSQKERDAVKEIEVVRKNIVSLTGLGYFKNLLKLNCAYNSLSKLDVSKNTALKQLRCNFNGLSELDASKNTNLEYLKCDYNILTKLELGDNTKITYLSCSENQLTKLDLSKNTNINSLNCYNNQLTKLELGDNTNLTNLQCYNNQLTNLDVSKSTSLKILKCGENQLTNLDVSNMNLEELDCSNQQYNITVIKGTREFKYSEFPGQFNKDKVTSPVGASFGDDALTVDNDTINEVTYNYKVSDNKEMNVKLNVTYIEFDPEHVESMVVKEQPTKLIYTEGEKLALAGLEVRLTDNKGVTKDVAFKDFEANGITAEPVNNTELTVADHNGAKVKLSKGNASVETFTLTVKAKELVKTGTDRNTPIPNGYTRIIFDATEDGNINGQRYKVIDVLTGTTWDNQAVKDEIPKTANYKDATKKFKGWDSTVPDTGEVEKQEFVAEYKSVVNKKPLQDKIAEAKEVLKNDNTTDPAKALAAKVTEAEKLINTATEQGQLDEKVTELDIAIKAVKELIAKKEEAKEEIGKLPNLSDDEKNDAKGKVDEATDKAGVDKAVEDAKEKDKKNKEAAEKTLEEEKGKAKEEIDKLPNLSDDEKDKYKKQVEDAKTKGEVSKVVEEAKEKSSGGQTPPTPTPSPIPNPGGYRDRDYWHRSYWTYSYGPASTTKVTPAKSNLVKQEAKLVIGSKEMIKPVDGVDQKVFMDIAPFIEGNRTMLPIRFVAEALGFNVQWDNENRTVILLDKENVVKIPVDTNKIIVNGKVYESDVKPIIRNDRTMLPIANIARAMGLKDGKDIFWNGNTKEVLITREVSK